MKYFSKYEDETFEQAKMNSMWGKGFDSIRQAIDVALEEQDFTIDHPTFVIVNENGVQVWPHNTPPNVEEWTTLNMQDLKNELESNIMTYHRGTHTEREDMLNFHLSIIKNWAQRKGLI